MIKELFIRRTLNKSTRNKEEIEKDLTIVRSKYSEELAKLRSKYGQKIAELALEYKNACF